MSEAKREPIYLERIAQEVWWATGETVPWYPATEVSLWLGYAVLVTAKGPFTTRRDVHDVWSAWAVIEHGGDHRSLVPFDELTPEIQAYDDLYRDAIHQVARTSIHGPIGDAYARYDSDPRVNGPDGFEAFRDAVAPFLRVKGAGSE